MLLLRNPFQNGVPGDPSPLSERLNSPTGLARQGGPDPQLTAPQAGLIRSFADTTPEAQGPSATAGRPGVAQGAEVFVSDGSPSNPSPVAMTPSQPAAATPPAPAAMAVASDQPSTPAALPTTSLRQPFSRFSEIATSTNPPSVPVAPSMHATATLPAPAAMAVVSDQRPTAAAQPTTSLQQPFSRFSEIATSTNPPSVPVAPSMPATVTTPGPAGTAAVSAQPPAAGAQLTTSLRQPFSQFSQIATPANPRSAQAAPSTSLQQPAGLFTTTAPPASQTAILVSQGPVTVTPSSPASAAATLASPGPATVTPSAASRAASAGVPATATGQPIASSTSAAPRAQSTESSAPVAGAVSADAQRTALAAASPTANRYVTEPKSAAASSGMAVFPMQIPQRADRIATGGSPNKTSTTGILLAQAAGPAGGPLADSSAGGISATSAGLEPGMAPCEGAQILARVGSEIILAADLAGPVNEMIMLNKDKIPPEQIELARRQLTRRMLDSRIETKLAYLDAKRQLPAESLTRVEKNISDAFDREEIDRMMKRSQADSRQALEGKLQSLGSSLELKRRAFIEQMLAQQWIRQKVKVEGEVSHEEMRSYYHEHIAEFETPAQARWEELEVRFARHPSREQAYALMAQMGNQILSGMPLAEVARRGSEGITASSGGQRDWTSRGSLVSQELDGALFGLPIGQPSQIIEDKTGFHILRVVERKEAVRTPFTEAQVEIRKKIKEQRVDSQMKAYLEKLRRQVPVWTVFDDASGKAGNARG
jgi:parvulin-like peptidyl-prolyl isomerase